MTKQPAEHRIIVLSIKVYGLLLNAYPTKFRREYGTQLIQLFRDCCVQTFQQSNYKGVLKLWFITILDLVQSVISEHLQKEIQMKAEDIRLAGLALIFGGINFIIVFISFSFNIFIALVLMVFFCIPLLAVGLLGISKRYGEKVGWFGRSILLLGAILGPIITILGPIFVIISTGNQPLPDEAEDVIEGLIAGMAFLLGPGTLFVSLTLFGIVAIYTKPLPRWNFVPIIAGGLSPFFFFVIPQIILTLNEAVFINIEERYWNIFYFVGVLQGIALMALGYVLQKDPPEDAVMPA